jgi:hypothetical protein
MSETAVFCPRCGLQSTDGLRFCKRCGTNLEEVSKVLTGALTPPAPEIATEVEVAYARRMSTAVYKLVGSLAAFLTFMVIFRQWWVFFLLFPVAHAVRDIIHAKFIKNNVTNPFAAMAALEETDKERKGKRQKRKRRRTESLPEAASETHPLYVAPPQPVFSSPAPTTGELEKPRELEFDPANPPPSVTEGTTRSLDDREREARLREYEPPRSR